MRRFLTISLLVGAFGVYIDAISTSAFAMTCSDRQQVCFAYCEKNYGGSPRCRGVCGELLGECMATGCWESRVTAKRCGITRQ